MIGKTVRFATLGLALTLLLTSHPEAIAASPDSPQQGAASSEKAAPKSEAAEAWDAVKNTTNPALLEAFIARYGTTFFAEIAKARLNELKAAAAKPPAGGAKPIPTYPIRANPGQEAPATGFRPALPPMPKDGAVERAVLYEEDPADAKGQKYDGSVIWHTETIKTPNQPDDLAARADVDIPSRGLRMTMLLKRNLDPALPASHVVELKIATSGNFSGGGITNIPGMLMKGNEQARGIPFAGLAVKVTDGFFLVGLSNVAADRARNLQLLAQQAWFDIPTVYGNQRRAILAIEKGNTGQQVVKAAFEAWGEQAVSAAPETAMPEDRSMPEEWKRSMKGQSKTE